MATQTHDHVTAPALRWMPRRDTAWALISVVLMWACYYANTKLNASHQGVALLIFFVLGNLLVCTALPALVVRSRGEGAWGLGFTRYRLIPAVVIMVVAGLGSLPYYLSLAADKGVDPVQHLAYNLVVFWEPLFVYGWLQLRFSQAFGWLPGILLAALGFVAYHLGSVPPAGLAVFFVTGLAFGSLMAITRNLWCIIPLTAAISSAIGTLQSGLSFDWTTAATGLVVLLVQVAILVWVFKGRSPRLAAQPV